MLERLRRTHTKEYSFITFSTLLVCLLFPLLLSRMRAQTCNS